MMDKIKAIVDGATWFMRSGVAPNKQLTHSEDLKSLNHMTSRKFAMTMVAVSVIAFMYFASVVFLFLLKGDPHVSALVNMYKDMIVAIASIVATLVGIQGLVDWKYNSDSNVSSSSSSEFIVQEEYLSGPKEEDYSLDINVVSNIK